MVRESPTRSWLLALLCVMLLVTRVGGLHLHLCFDGNEVPASLHLSDSGLHHATPDLDAAHHDTDVAFAGDALTKLSKLGLDLTALLAAIMLGLGLLPRPGQPVPAYRFSRTSSVARFLRPPLRGPPLLLSH